MTTSGKRFQVLALSGGGYRGLYTAKILADIESELGGPVGRHFDLIAGTSIGGILALAVALEILPGKWSRCLNNTGKKSSSGVGH